MSASQDELDPFDDHFRRDPLPDAAVLVVVLPRDEGPHRAREAAEALSDLLARCGRQAVAAEAAIPGGWGQTLESSLLGASAPLILVTSAEEPWTPGHLGPLLEAIDRCDHVVGRRRASPLTRIRRWLGGLPWRLIFALPVEDLHSPCRLHRLDKLRAIPLQSASEFLDVEVLAKATFFGHLIDEVPVPPLAGRSRRGSFWRDFVEVFRRPVLARPSRPAEDPQRDVEGDDGPGREDRHGGGDVEPARPLEDHPAEPAHHLGQG